MKVKASKPQDQAQGIARSLGGALECGLGFLTSF